MVDKEVKYYRYTCFIYFHFFTFNVSTFDVHVLLRFKNIQKHFPKMWVSKHNVTCFLWLEAIFKVFIHHKSQS